MAQLHSAAGRGDVQQVLSLLKNHPEIPVDACGWGEVRIQDFQVYYKTRTVRHFSVGYSVNKTEEATYLMRTSINPPSILYPSVLVVNRMGPEGFNRRIQ